MLLLTTSVVLLKLTIQIIILTLLSGTIAYILYQKDWFRKYFKL